MKNVTKKQMITLVVLIAVLFIVIAVQYFYRPMLTEKAELEEKIENMEIIYDDMKMMSALYSIDAVTYDEEKKALADERAGFYQIMTNSQQDEMITRLLNDCHISVDSSNISPLVKDTIQVECVIDKDKEDSVDAYSAISMYPQGGKVVSAESRYMVLEYETGECSREIYYSISGKYRDIVSFLKKVHAQKGMEVSSFYFNSGDLDSLVAVKQEEIKYDENGEIILSDDNAVKTDKIIENTIYTAGVGVKVHMYDRNFDLVPREDY